MVLKILRKGDVIRLKQAHGTNAASTTVRFETCRWSM